MSLMRMPVYVDDAGTGVCWCWRSRSSRALIELLFTAPSDETSSMSRGLTGVVAAPLWVFGHPEVYILILPAMVSSSEVLPVSQRSHCSGTRRRPGRCVIAFMGWMSEPSHVHCGTRPSQFGLPGNDYDDRGADGHRKCQRRDDVSGSLNLKTPMLFSIAFAPCCYRRHQRRHARSELRRRPAAGHHFIVAHIHYVLFGGAIFAILSGVYYWSPS